MSDFTTSHSSAVNMDTPKTSAFRTAELIMGNPRPSKPTANGTMKVELASPTKPRVASSNAPVFDPLYPRRILDINRAFVVIRSDVTVPPGKLDVRCFIGGGTSIIIEMDEEDVSHLPRFVEGAARRLASERLAARSNKVRNTRIRKEAGVVPVVKRLSGYEGWCKPTNGRRIAGYAKLV